MPRQPRIEYAGATYHVMCRGDHREAIYSDDSDCERFLQTLGEVSLQTGWVIHAYVLMGNHYHLLLETPEANLVAGMKWFQGTYTQRFNARHKQSGHLFQGRYKSLSVDAGDPHYFQSVASYIHLNPARAGLVNVDGGSLADYRWSSYPAYLRPSRRPTWLAADRLLASYGQCDDARGRRYYRQKMKRRLLELLHSQEPWRIDEEWERIRRGWCFGSEAFREELLDRLGHVLEGQRRDSHAGAQVRAHDEKSAEELVKKGLRALGLREADIALLRKGDSNKRLLAWLVRTRTRVSNEWISKRLSMGSPSNLSRHVQWVAASEEDSVCRRRQMLLEAMSYED